MLEAFISASVAKAPSPLTPPLPVPAYPEITPFTAILRMRLVS